MCYVSAGPFTMKCLSSQMISTRCSKEIVSQLASARVWLKTVLIAGLRLGENGPDNGLENGAQTSVWFENC